MRRERRAVEWLASAGAPSGVATALVWIVKLTVLGVLQFPEIIGGSAAKLVDVVTRQL
jgi:hypothetical protein